MSQTLSPSFARCYYRSLKETPPNTSALALVRLALVRTRNWQTTSASTLPPPAFTARATASYGRDCASRAFAQVPGVCDG